MEWLRNLPKVTQLVNDRARIQTQAAWLHDLCFWPQHHAFPVQIWIQLFLQQSGSCSPPEVRGAGPDLSSTGWWLWGLGLWLLKFLFGRTKICTMVPPDIEKILGGWLCMYRIKNKNTTKSWNKFKGVQPIPNFSRWFVAVVIVGISNYSHPSVSMGGWFQGPPWIPKSSDDRVPDIKWCSICL